MSTAAEIGREPWGQIGISQYRLAKAISVPQRRIGEIQLLTAPTTSALRC